MENVIYNELRQNDFLVDVGDVETRTPTGARAHLEVDFIANKGSYHYYIQSAYQLQDAQNEEQEKRSLLLIGDFFKKVLIVSGHYPPMLDDNGITTVGLFQFLANPNIIE